LLRIGIKVIAYVIGVLVLVGLGRIITREDFLDSFLTISIFYVVIPISVGIGF
jgi:hypothetical protein